MTRINCIPPEELTRQHLIAEYRELPRIYNLVRKKVYSKTKANSIKMNPSYQLGAGHVTFFYNKLGWLTDRYISLCVEMINRGYKVNFGNVNELTKGIPLEWFGSWEPTEEAMMINRKRIEDRLRSS